MKIPRKIKKKMRHWNDMTRAIANGDYTQSLIDSLKSKLPGVKPGNEYKAACANCGKEMTSGEPFTGHAFCNILSCFHSWLKNQNHVSED